MNRLARTGVTTGMTLTLAAMVAAPATAAPLTATAPKVRLKGGTTTVTTGPGIARTLLNNKLAAYAVRPGQTSVSFGGGLALSFSFPVTGGAASLRPLGGKVLHQGSIAFVNLANFKRVKVGNFTIDLSKGVLTGIVNGNPRARVALFTLDLSKAKITKGHGTIVARGVGLKLTGTAAGALNAALSTKLFSAGLPLGSATSTLRV